MKRRLLACMMLLLLSIQVLPLKEIGKLLYQSALTEELHEVVHDEVPKTKKYDTYASSGTLHAVMLIRAAHDVSLAIAYSDNLPVLHPPDIFVPPPNC